ncbi:hypothetical protein M3Y99_00522300 [Aphelenchoides fujianensis]|nr:hypothetical protein M3Y99_00522300 [Aphelenchoides fujianensis]
MSEEKSECRHEPNGNALCSFRLPAGADRDYLSRAYELNPQRADGIFFKMFYFCKSKDGRDWADPIAELGVVVSEFACWKSADYFRRFRFARGPQRWKFRLPRRVLVDAQADCGPLRAEFAIELDDRERAHWPPKRGRPSNASGRSSAHSDRVSPERPRRRRNSAGDRSSESLASLPSDPNGSTFFMHLQDIREQEVKQPRQTFEDVDFIPRFFPPDRWGRTSNFEFFLFHFHEREHVRLTIDWALKNWLNEMKFHERSQYTFHRCRCPPHSRCKHRKTYFRVPTDELEDFADGRAVTLVLKLRSGGHGARSASPPARSEALERSESPVPPAGFANPYIDYGVLDGSPRGVQPPPASGGPVVELQPTDGPHFVPPPIPLSVQPQANGVPVGAYVNAINEMLTRATGAGTSASAPPPAAAVSPATPTIRVKEEPTDEETIEKEPPAPPAPPTAKLTIPSFTVARRAIVVKPIEVNRNTQESREKEIVPTPPPTETPPLAANPKETHPPNATETVRIKQEPQVDEQPQVEPPKEQRREEPAAVDVEEETDESDDDDDDESDEESSSEEEPEIEEVTARKRRLDPPASSRSGRTPTKRPRQGGKAEKAEETLPNPKVLNKNVLAVVVDGKEFEVERNLLIEESAFFAKKVAKQESLVDCLPAEISGDTMAAVVYWMETKRVDDLDKKARELYVAAKLLGMPDLQKTCVESIKRTSKQRKATAGVVFAVQHEDADLLSAMGFVWKRAKRMRKVLKSKEFRQLLEQRPELIHKVLDAM